MASLAVVDFAFVGSLGLSTLTFDEAVRIVVRRDILALVVLVVGVVTCGFGVD